jgi:hypothetical protein
MYFKGIGATGVMKIMVPNMGTVLGLRPQSADSLCDRTVARNLALRLAQRLFFKSCPETRAQEFQTKIHARISSVQK